MSDFRTIRGIPLLFCVLLACITPTGSGRPAVAPDEGPRHALSRFVDAIEAGSWTEAYGLLSARWRGQLTPARLAADYTGSEAVGRGATARVRALLAGGASLEVNRDLAILPVGEGRAAMVLFEGGAWKVDALE
jgi:hypothetical protein